VEGPEGLLQRLAADEAHGVAGPAVPVPHQAVDRHDPGVLQPPGDFGLAQEAAAALGVVGVPRLDAFEGHLAAQLGVLGHVDLTEPAAGVETHRPVAHRAGLGQRRQGVVRGRRRQVQRRGTVAESDIWRWFTGPRVTAGAPGPHQGLTVRAAMNVSRQGFDRVAGKPPGCQGGQLLGVGTAGGVHDEPRGCSSFGARGEVRPRRLEMLPTSIIPVRARRSTPGRKEKPQVRGSVCQLSTTSR
jgi:hypothetical protein